MKVKEIWELFFAQGVVPMKIEIDFVDANFIQGTLCPDKKQVLRIPWTAVAWSRKLG